MKIKRTEGSKGETSDALGIRVCNWRAGDMIRMHCICA